MIIKICQDNIKIRKVNILILQVGRGERQRYSIKQYICLYTSNLVSFATFYYYLYKLKVSEGLPVAVASCRLLLTMNVDIRRLLVFSGLKDVTESIARFSESHAR